MNQFFRTTKQYFALVLALCLPLNTTLALTNNERKNKDCTLYERIADQYLPNYGTLEGVLAKEKTGDATLDGYETRQIMFEMFNTHAIESKQTETGILNKNSWSDLSLFESVSEEKSVTLLGILNNTQTVMGEIKLAQMLTQLTDDIQQLKKRQAIVKELVENETLFDDLDEALKDMKKHEEAFLSFRHLRDEKRFDDLYFNQKGVLKKGNTSSVALEAGTRPRDLLKGLPFLFTVGGAAALAYKIRKALGVGNLPNDMGELQKRLEQVTRQAQRNLTQADFDNPFTLEKKIIGQLTEEQTVEYGHLKNRLVWEGMKQFFATTGENLTEDQIKQLKMVKVFMIVYFGLIFGSIAKLFYDQHKSVKLTQELRKKMYKVSEFVFSMDDMAVLAGKNSVLKNGLSALSDDGKILDALCKKHSNLNHLVGHLSSWSVRSTAYMTHYCTPVGRALAGYKLMKNEGQKFAPLMECVGELDAYLSMAKLYKKWSGHPTAKICYVNYLAQSQPECTITGMWNPFVPQDIVITNDIAIGAAHGTQNMIITGPNAGGKSTVLKAIIINALMASFGIACAESMSITPYSKISTHLNIIDAPGIKSLFQAEVYRAQELIDTIKGLKDGQFALTIMDEVFSGTNPIEGEAAAFSIGEYIAKYNQSNCIIATHYPRLTLLPQYTSNKFKNFKVYVNMLEDGSFSYPYDFVAGVADQRIAIDILETEGFDTTILQRARDIIDNPDNYLVP